MIAASVREIALAVHRRDGLLVLIKQCLRMILWPTIPLGIAIMAFGPWALGLFGTGFEAAAPMLWMLVPAMALAAMVILLGFSMTLTPFVAPMAYQFDALTVVGLAAFALAIRLAGPIGAAAGLLAFEVIKTTWGAWLFRRYLRSIEA